MLLPQFANCFSIYRLNKLTISKSDLRFPQRQACGGRFIHSPKRLRNKTNYFRWNKACGRPQEQLNVDRVDYNWHRYGCTKASVLICLLSLSFFFSFFFFFSVCIWRSLTVGSGLQNFIVVSLFFSQLWHFKNCTIGANFQPLGRKAEKG